MKQIEWSQARYGGQSGRIGKTELFHISYTTNRADGESWVLRHHLPVSRTTRKFKTTAEAQEWAQNFLKSFVRWLGADPVDR